MSILPVRKQRGLLRIKISPAARTCSFRQDTQTRPKQCQCSPLISSVPAPLSNVSSSTICWISAASHNRRCSPAASRNASMPMVRAIISYPAITDMTMPARSCVRSPSSRMARGEITCSSSAVLNAGAQSGLAATRTSAIIDAHLARLGEASGGGTFGIEAGALGPPSPSARSLSATYPASPPRPSYPASPSRSTYSVSPPRSPIPFAPVCPPPPRAPSPTPSPLTLDGLGLGGRPPGLDAPSEAETLQTEISESLSDALR